MLAMTRWPFGKPGTSSNITAGLPILRMIDVDDAADLLLRLGALDDLQLAGRLDAARSSPANPCWPSLDPFFLCRGLLNALMSFQHQALHVGAN